MKLMAGLFFGSLWLALAAFGQAVSNSVGPQLEMVPMRDGVRLATDVYALASRGPLPVVLVRTPYNKNGLAGAAQGAVQLGYAVVVQDARGRFASEGDNLPFNVDDQDGYDTLQWIAKQTWCNGKIGTYGGSALGIAQLQLAGTGATELVCQHITVGGPSIYQDVVYSGGVFRKALVEDWLRASAFSPKALEVWTRHYAYDAYWEQRDSTRRYAEVNVPAVHIGGYFDIFARGTIDAFLGYQTKGGPKARGRQKLLMGPWTHAVLTDKAGDLVFPHAKSPPNNVQDQLRWWEYYLKGISNGMAELPAVTYYVMGDVTDTNAPGNAWRTADQWPPVATQPEHWYFHADRTLSSVGPVGSETMTYVYDPKNPVPTVGGYELTIPAGPKDQRPIETRQDVLVFTTAPLSSPVEVIGSPHVQLLVSSDARDTDFLARLCDVYPDGRSFNICEGIIRARYRNSFAEENLLVPGKAYQLKIDLWPTSIVFNKGHRLRVHITSSSAPGYDPNPNTGEPLRSSDRSVPARNTVHLSTEYPAEIELPVSANASHLKRE
jgi:predicted acyl esterase